VAASISMYEHFPGDNFTAPWLNSAAFPGNDPAHLEAAMRGYKWLIDVNMTNSLGLFVDGYHIDSTKPGNTKCDLRDEMVYTYNQGVLLTGQRGLWSVSGSASYLEDGHRLIQSVIRATGWNLKENKPVDDLKHLGPGQLPLWHGLGRGGILEESAMLVAPVHRMVKPSRAFSSTTSLHSVVLLNLWSPNRTERSIPMGIDG